MKRVHDRRARGGDTRARESNAAEETRVAISGFSGRSQGDEKGRVGAQFSTLPSENAVGSSLCYGRNNVTLRRELVDSRPGYLLES